MTTTARAAVARPRAARESLRFDRVARFTQTRRVDQRHGTPPMSTRSVTRRGSYRGFVTMARRAPTSALNRLDLPALGRPTIRPVAPSRTSAGAAADASASKLRIDAPIRPRAVARDRNGIPRRENRAMPRAAPTIEQRGVDPSDRGRQRALELIHGGRAPAAA